MRNKDQFIFEHRDSVNENDKSLTTTFNFFNYKQSYFWYNNTVKNFPQFAYDEENPNIKDSENFCIHLWYNPIQREKAYGAF